MRAPELRARVVHANQELVRHGLVHLTWGNVSECDREEGIIAIKPSGVSYAELTAESIVIIDWDGKTVDGDLKPSSDLATHLEIFRNFDGVGGVTHTHSTAATAFSQAGKPLPCFGTTHADHFFGEVPLVRELNEEEVAEAYEENTGKAIVEHFQNAGLDPLAVPACLQKFHAPFIWGASAMDSVKNAVALEMCCDMALKTLSLNPDAQALPSHILRKHYLRKHGPGAYYGQG